LLLNQLEGRLDGVGLDIHDYGFKARGFGHRDAVFDLLLARGSDQHFDLFRPDGEGPPPEVQVDLLEREWDVLVGLGFDLNLQLFVAQPRRYDDLLW